MTSTLTQLWGWEASDRILHVLPLHHIHGLGNALLCPLLAGACVEFQQGFSPSAVWAALQVASAPVCCGRVLGTGSWHSGVVSGGRS